MYFLVQDDKALTGTSTNRSIVDKIDNLFILIRWFEICLFTEYFHHVPHFEKAPGTHPFA